MKKKVGQRSAAVHLLDGQPIFLEYEQYDKYGNIRLKNPVTKTGVKIGDRVAESPGNGMRPIKMLGTVTSVEMSHSKWLMVSVKWDSGDEWVVNGDYLERVHAV